jgi:hypothetical protein
LNRPLKIQISARVHSDDLEDEILELQKFELIEGSGFVSLTLPNLNELDVTIIDSVGLEKTVVLPVTIITPNGKPTDGEVTISPESGFAGETFFEISLSE